MYIIVMTVLISVLRTERHQDDVLLSQGKPTLQDSVAWGGFSRNANDGNNSTKFYDKSCTHSSESGISHEDEVLYKWWRVDLGRNYNISSILVYNRDKVAERLMSVVIAVDGLPCSPAPLNDDKEEVEAKCGFVGRVVSAYKRVNFKTKVLTLCEVRVYGRNVTDTGQSRSYPVEELQWSIDTATQLLLARDPESLSWGTVCGYWMNKTAADLICGTIENISIAYYFETKMIPRSENLTYPHLINHFNYGPAKNSCNVSTGFQRNASHCNLNGTFYATALSCIKAYSPQHNKVVKDSCRYTNTNGFLKRICETETGNGPVFSCPGNNTEFWQVEHKFTCRHVFPHNLWNEDTCYVVSEQCSDSLSRNIQMCGYDTELTLRNGTTCGFLCRTDFSPNTVFPYDVRCDNKDDCSDGSDEKDCPEEGQRDNFEKCTFNNLSWIPTDTTPPRCDERYLECGGAFHFNDEVDCNHETGKDITVNDSYTEEITPLVKRWWLHPNYACENDTKFYVGPDCYDNTTKYEGIYCEKFDENKTIYLPDFKTCTNPKFADSAIDVKFCKNWREQMNCTINKKRIALSCIPVGFESLGLTNITEYLVCGRGRNCVDGIDEACVQAASNCIIHRHRQCDTINDCWFGEDEENCQLTTNFKCKRKLVRKDIAGLEFIPISWIMDKITDCQDGQDENESAWMKCSYSFRDHVKQINDTKIIYLEKHRDCENLYRIEETGRLLSQSHVCDNIASFPSETQLCEVSRGFKEKIFIVQEYEDMTVLAPCLPGVEVYGLQCHNTILQRDEGIWGVGRHTWTIQKDKYECKHLFATMYSLMTCLGMCQEDTPCALKRIEAGRCYKNLDFATTTIKLNEPNKGMLSKVLISKEGVQNVLFECGNGNCIDSSKVCNLADDCGDGSDEVNCINQFYCNETKERLTLDKVCDGNIDCRDAKDECDNCPQTLSIINNMHLRNFAWIIGILSVIINAMVIIKSVLQLHGMDKTTTRFRDTIFITLIACGDLMVGTYLLLIAIVDVVKGEKYCSERYLWLGSIQCQILGIFSSIGSQISLFTMTALSLYRLQKICNLLSSNRLTMTSTTVSMASVVLVVGLSVLISIIPNVASLEDYFINGLSYPDVTLFIGNVNKQRHLDILQAHFGRIRFQGKVLSWGEIRRLVIRMFSLEPTPVHGSGIGFYGNAGVCLFKYFVTSSDSQQYFSLSILAVNITCFFVITVAYTLVVIISRRLSDEHNNDFNSTLQKKITFIIVSDGLCWVPFITLGLANYFNIMDATSYYEFCSIVILPINSLVNPVIYHSEFKRYWMKFKAFANGMNSSIFLRTPDVHNQRNTEKDTTQPSSDVRVKTTNL